MTQNSIGQMPVWSAIPFLGILLSIALVPLVSKKFWHRWYPGISLAWALLFAVPAIIATGTAAVHELAHSILFDYLPFIIVLVALYGITGGIHIEGDFSGTPLFNTLFLLAGSVLASLMGTMGASMLLIRPLVRANAWRSRRVHTVVFFIFLVGNIGGALTPLGDPPLFIGFLRGVPFFWTLNLLPHWLMGVMFLLIVYLAIDTWCFRREAPRQNTPRHAPFRLRGAHNLVILMGVIVVITASGFVELGSFTLGGMTFAIVNLLKDLVLLALTALSLLVTTQSIRRKNSFHWEPIREVAFLFAGIFITIIPVLSMLRAGDDGPLGFITGAAGTPAQYFWIVGILSSFLDNAPTYLAFVNSAIGTWYPGMDGAIAVRQLVADYPQFLAAISAGAVFMGALTYIGNAPNLVIKTIAEDEYRIPMPSFFGYMFRYSLPVLLGLFVMLTAAFFR